MKDEKGELREAVRDLNRAARAALRDHPEVESLTDYRAGKLSPEAAERIRDHLTLCRECRGLVLDFGTFADVSLDGDRLPTADIDSDWKRLYRHLRSENRPVPAVAAPLSRSQSSRLAWALAAVLAAAVVGLAIWVQILRHDLIEVAGPRLNPSVIDLIALDNPIREDASRQQVVFPAVVDQVVLILNPTLQHEFPDYGLDILTSPEGKLRWSRRELWPGAEGNFTLALPRAFLPVGHYWLELYGIADGERQPLAMFEFEIVDEP